VCSPGYLEKHPELRQASDIHDQTLLHLEGGGNIWGALDWPAFLVTQGVSGRLQGRGIRMNSYPMVLQGAEAGRGVALGWSYITDEMLAENRLVRPCDGEIETRNGYYIGASERSATRPAVDSFLEWIEEEVSG
jgi:DNA-binding transcriptional LysR family regulator